MQTSRISDNSKINSKSTIKLPRKCDKINQWITSKKGKPKP